MINDGDDDCVIIRSPLERKISRGGVTIEIKIYRGEGDPGWLMEIENEAGGCRFWRTTFPTDQAALDEALSAIEAEGIRMFGTDAQRAKTTWIRRAFNRWFA